VASRAGKGQRERAEAIYRFVRDEIANEPRGLSRAPDESVDATLERGRGDVREKSFLLIAMLDAVKVKARPVLAAGRRHGLVDLKLANPAWFKQAAVAAEIDGKRVYLYLADRSLAFGQLPSELEGTIGVIPDRKKPEGVSLPEEPFDHNGRRAVLKLAVNEKGVVQGSGTVLLTGQHATERIGWKDDAEKTTAAWKEWLEKSYKDYTISDVKVSESTEEGKVEIHWAMAERAEEALGDQVSLEPSRPFGPFRQPFTVPAAQRRSPVLFDYADREEIEITLTWPAGWSVERRPQATHQENDAGALASDVEVKEAERTLVFKRRVDVTKKQILTLQGVERIRALFATLEKSDAEPLVLVRR